MVVRWSRTKAAWLLVVPYLALARPAPWSLALGAALTALGLLIRGWSAGTIRKEEELTTSGPYAYTRNPLYLGSLCIGTGLGVAGGNWIWPALFVGFFAAVYRRTMARESERLSRLFGGRYLEYAANVPALLPRLTRYDPKGVKAAPGFRWSRYGRHREWEALLGSAAAFLALVMKMLWPA